MYIPTTKDYLDRILRESLEQGWNLRYDSDIARALGISKTTISKYRQDKNMSILIAVKIAELLRINPMETIAATMARQSQDEEEKNLWMHYYERYRTPKTE